MTRPTPPRPRKPFRRWTIGAYASALFDGRVAFRITPASWAPPSMLMLIARALNAGGITLPKRRGAK